METCKNCEQKFNGDYNYCPHCGQNAKDDLTLKVLFYNTISNYLSFDARFYKSVLPLMFKPGNVARKFVEGKRLTYIHPAQMYLFIAIIFFFLFSFVQREQVRTLDENVANALKNQEQETNTDFNTISDSLSKQIDSEAQLNTSSNKETRAAKQAITKQLDDNDFWFDTKVIDSLLHVSAHKDSIYSAIGLKKDAGPIKKMFVSQALKLYQSKQAGGIVKTFYDTIPVAMFFLLPIFALILKVLHFKRGRYAQHLVFSFYYFSFLFTVFSLILIVNFMLEIPNWLDFLVMLSTFIYLVSALRTFYKQSWTASILKSMVTAFVFLSIVVPIAITILGVYAFMFY